MQHKYLGYDDHKWLGNDMWELIDYGREELCKTLYWRHWVDIKLHLPNFMPFYLFILCFHSIILSYLFFLNSLSSIWSQWSVLAALGHCMQNKAATIFAIFSPPPLFFLSGFSEVVQGFQNTMYDYWRFGRVVCRWLCRHLCWTISTLVDGGTRDTIKHVDPEIPWFILLFYWMSLSYNLVYTLKSGILWIIIKLLNKS